MRAIILAVDLGHGLAPMTKVIPEVMVPVAGKPLIQHAIEEVYHAGIRDLRIVLPPRGNLIEDYLKVPALIDQSNPDPWQLLLRECKFQFETQTQPLGLGDALLQLAPEMDGHPFALVQPQHLHVGRSPILKRLVEAHRDDKINLVGLHWVSPAETKRFSNAGNIDTKRIEGDLHEVTIFREKTDGPFQPEKRGPILRAFGRAIVSFAFVEALLTRKGIQNSKRRETRRIMRSLEARKLDDVFGYQELIARGGLYGIAADGDVFECTGWENVHRAQTALMGKG